MSMLSNWWNGGGNNSNGNDLCEVCNARPKYRDSFRVHPYCGKSCAAKAPNCFYPGCGAKGTREYGGYCSQKHQKATVYCASCKSTPANPGHALCSNCQMMQDKNRNRLVELPPNDTGFQEAQQMLISGWPRGVRPPQVGRVFKIMLGENSQLLRSQYKNSGDSSRLPIWYSGQNICELGGPTKPVEFCQYKSCGICIPLKSGFSAFEFGQKYQTGPHGNGIYTTREPAVADKHAISSTGTPYRVVILASLTIPSNASREFILGNNNDVFCKNPLAITPDYLIAYNY